MLQKSRNIDKSLADLPKQESEEDVRKRNVCWSLSLYLSPRRVGVLLLFILGQPALRGRGEPAAQATALCTWRGARLSGRQVLGMKVLAGVLLWSRQPGRLPSLAPSVCPQRTMLCLLGRPCSLGPALAPVGTVAIGAQWYLTPSECALCVCTRVGENWAGRMLSESLGDGVTCPPASYQVLRLGLSLLPFPLPRSPLLLSTFFPLPFPCFPPLLTGTFS